MGTTLNAYIIRTCFVFVCFQILCASLFKELNWKYILILTNEDEGQPDNLSTVEMYMVAFLYKESFSFGEENYVRILLNTTNPFMLNNIPHLYKKKICPKLYIKLQLLELIINIL